MTAPRPTTLVVDSPAREETIGEVPVFDDDQVKAAVARARAAQESWAASGVKARVAVLRRVREQLLARMDEVAEQVMRENGKAKAEAVMHEVGPLVLQLTWLLKRAPKLLAPRAPGGLFPLPRKTLIHARPRGVVGVISPWNFPFLIPFSAAVEALLAGNAVVLKPSEHTPLVALLGKSLFEAGGLPPDLLQVVTGNASTGSALLESGVDLVCFTGSVNGGRRVAQRCGELLVPCVMELGGKAPLIVMEDADRERAANAIVFGGFANAGQICLGVERVYLHESLYDDVLARVAEKVRALRQGDPEREEVDIGAVTMPAQLALLQSLVDDARAKGARVMTGGERLSRRGRFFPPTVIADATHEMRCVREEIFGPLVPVLRYRGEDEVVRLANDTHLGLNAYVFGRDRERARHLAAQLRAGQVIVNDVFLNYVMPELPFGGVAASGFGRVHGDEGLLGMTVPQVIVDDRGAYAPSQDPWWFPYEEKKTGLILTWLRRLIGILDVTTKG
ncbi:MAG: aldehyde dehydrogenase family protein [Myxococcota bacterium]